MGAHPGDALAAAGVGGRLGDEQAGDAGEVLGALARGIDVEDHGEVGRARARGRTRVASRCVREYRCGWKQATTRRGLERARGGDRRRAPRSGGARSRRRRSAPVGGRAERARSGGRRPRSSPARCGRAATSAPASLIAVSAAAALRALWAPGTASVDGDAVEVEASSRSRVSSGSASKTVGSPASAHEVRRARPAARASARKARNVSSTSRCGGVGRVVVELGVGDDRDRRARA